MAAAVPPRYGLGMRRAPWLMFAACALFTVMMVLVKQARAEMSTVDVMVWRSASSVPLAFLLALGPGLAVRNVRAMAWRVVLGALAMGSYYTAVKGLSLADLTLLTKLQPLEVAVLAPLVLGAAEAASLATWVAIGLGLTGTAVLLGPQLAVGSTWGLWALASATFSAGAHVSLRALGNSEDPRTVVLWFQAGATLLAIPVALLLDGALPGLPPSHLWPHMIGIGVTATLGQVLMTRAYAVDRAPVVAAAAYVEPLFMFVADAVVFHVAPSLSAVVGGGLILGSGLLLIAWRERVAAPARQPSG